MSDRGLEVLARMEYPGRFIIIGNDISNPIVVYGITGRSSASQARKIILKNDTAYVEPTDEESIKKSDRNLLIYPAAVWNPNQGIVVSNGQQTKDVQNSFRKDTKPLQILVEALQGWGYEPDVPNYTPRISGCVNNQGAALSLIKRADDSSNIKQYFGLPLIPNQGKLISTYNGINVNPLPSFTGEPLDVKLNGQTPKEIAQKVWQSLNPDYRVAIVCLFLNSEPYIINRHEVK